jgi:zinc protease
MRRIRSAAACACALAVIVTTFASTPVVRAQSAPQVEFEKYRLANGLQVILHEDRKLPAVNVNLWYHVGSKNEKPGRTGFAHLFEHMMFQGSKNAKGEYLQLVERAGANLRTGGVNGTTNNDRTNYFETVPTESLEYAIWLESDRMGFLLDTLTKENLDNQREVVKNEKRQGENQPYGRAFQLIFENLFPRGHPYSWAVIGSMEDLSAASVDDVKDFFRTYYTPNNATLAIVGNFDPAQAKQLVEKYFGPLAPGPALERPELWYPTLEGEKRVAVSDRVPQPRIFLVYPSVAYFKPGEAELDVTASVLGDGKNSRLYKTLVYDKQLASEVSVFNFSLEIAGAFVVDVTARPGQSLDAVAQIVDEEVARLAKEGPTPEEIERAKAKIEYGFVSGLERIGGFGGKADLLNRYNTYLGEPDFFDEDAARYQKLTAQDVRGVANQYLNTKNRLVVTYTPEESSRPTAQEFDRSKIPAIGDRASFTAPDPKTKTLANGLTVIVAERRDLPTVAVNLVVKSGGANDVTGKPGTASMTARMLDEGTTTRSALQIASEIERLGANLGVGAGAESSSISLEALTRNLKPSLAIMADVVLNPAFAVEELERQRKLRLDEIAQELQNPAAAAAQLFPKLLFGESHPYGQPVGGVAESIQAVTAADLKAFHAANYKPNNSALIFSGDVSLDQAVALAEEQFGSWKRADVPAINFPETKAVTENVVYLVDRQDAPQSQIRIGSFGPPRSTEDYFAVEVMNTVLGGGFSSRLNLNLRENKGYAYGAFNNLVYRTRPGYWASTAGVKTEVTKESLVEFENEIKGISGERPVSAAELADAKANLVRGYAQRFETNAQVAGEIGTLFAYGLPLETLTRYAAGIDAVTPDQVAAAARKYVDASKTVILVVGDLAKIEQPVRSLNLGRVVVIDARGQPIANR